MINGKTFFRVGGQVEVNEGLALRGCRGVVVVVVMVCWWCRGDAVRRATAV